MALLDKRKEVLRLYREILRSTRMFLHPNEQGKPWSSVLQQNARMEIEQNRHEMVGVCYGCLLTKAVVNSTVIFIVQCCNRIAKPFPSAFSLAGNVYTKSEKRSVVKTMSCNVANIVWSVADSVEHL